MTATERLRELLDERGVKYETEDRPTIRYTEWGDWVFAEPLDAKPHTLGAQCELMRIPATPEQAIAATLGNDGAERSNDGVAERGTCHMKRSQDECYDEHTGEEWSVGCWKCTACGENVAGGATSNGVTAGPRYCPVCGAKVVGE